VGLEELKPIIRRDHPMKINIPEGTESLFTHLSGASQLWLTTPPPPPMPPLPPMPLFAAAISESGIVTNIHPL